MTSIEILERAEDYVGIHYINGVEEPYINPCLLAAIKDGVEAIHAQQQPEKNEPLTLEELREMDGEPVFCVDKVIPKRSAWGIVCIRNEIPFIRTFQDGGRFSTFFYLGKLNFDWLAYRHKPEEGME